MTHPPFVSPVIPNRPLSVGDILQATFTLYKRGFGTIIVIAILPSVVSIIATLLGLVLLIAPLLPLLLGIAGFGADWGALAAAVSGSMLLGVAVIILGSLLSIVAQYWAGATVAVAIQQLDAGQRPTVGSLWRQNPGLLGRCFGLAGLLVALMLALGAAVLVTIVVAAAARWGFLAIWAIGALVVGSIVVSGRLALAMPVLGVERLGPMAALKRSWQLTDFHVWRVVGITLLVGVLIFAGQQIVTGTTNTLLRPLLDQIVYSPGQPIWPMLATALPALALTTLLGIAYSIVTTPVVWMVNAVLYIDLVRRPAMPPGRATFGPPTQPPQR